METTTHENCECPFCVLMKHKIGPAEVKVSFDADGGMTLKLPNEMAGEICDLTETERTQVEYSFAKFALLGAEEYILAVGERQGIRNELASVVIKRKSKYVYVISFLPFKMD